MKTIWRVFFLAFSLALLALQPARSAPQQPAALRLGVHMHPLQDTYAAGPVARQIGLANRLGVSLVRIDIHWAWIEPNAPGPSRWNSSQVERLEAFLERIAQLHPGAQILAVVTETPCWASSDPGKHCAQYQYDWRYPPADPGDFARFLGHLAERYGDRIDAWEIWGEPNIPGYWANPNPAVYTALLKAASPAIKARDPQALVIGGCLAPWDGSPEYPLDALEYLEGMYQAGAKGAFDRLSFHPYTDGNPPSWYDARWPMHSFAHSVPAVRQKMLAWGDSSPIWLTEMGWTTVPAGQCADCWTPTLPVTESEQAAYMQEALAIASGWDYVEAFVWYELVDTPLPPTSTASFEYYFGLYRKDFSPKPAGQALQQLLLPEALYLPLLRSAAGR